MTAAKHTPGQIPTFDDWYAANHFGRTFEQDHQQTHQTLVHTFRALSLEMRKYISEMAAEVTK